MGGVSSYVKHQRAAFYLGMLTRRIIQESETATITLKDDNPRTVERMLSYLYTLDYSDDDDNPLGRNLLLTFPFYNVKYLVL